jgi:hypothetical protein
VRCRAELFYAVTASPDPAVLRVVARWADGLEVASARELGHTTATIPRAWLTFDGPDMTPAEITAAVRAWVADGANGVGLVWREASRKERPEIAGELIFRIIIVLIGRGYPLNRNVAMRQHAGA